MEQQANSRIAKLLYLAGLRSHLGCETSAPPLGVTGTELDLEHC